MIPSLVTFLIANKFVIVGVLFGLSEALAAIPKVKANGVFQLFAQAVAKARETLKPAA